MWSFPESIDVIKLRRLHKNRKGISVALAASIIPGILIALGDSPGIYNGLQTLGGVIYSVISFPIYLAINSIAFSHFSKYNIGGLKENYFNQMQKIKQLPHF